MSNLLACIVVILLIIFFIGIIVLQVHEKVKNFPQSIYEVITPLHTGILLVICAIFSGLMGLLFDYNCHDFWAEFLLLIALVVIWDFIVKCIAWLICKIKYK
jgi:hypothetical protein